MTKQREAWVDVAKGVCITAVVTLYAVERVDALPGSGADWLGLWAAFARPFRMPDFFLISGLFLSRVIDRPWRLYLDKKAVHYLYFFALWSLIYFPFVAALKGRPATAPAALVLLARMFYEPYAMLWFVQMLALYFVAAKLLRRLPSWLVLAAAAAWQMNPVESGWHQLDRFGERFVYFYAGYALAPRFFRLASGARAHPRPALLALAAWTLVNGACVGLGWAVLPGASLALGFLGAGAVIAASSLLSGARAGAWLAWLGERSLVVYLGFLLPMNALVLVLKRTEWTGDRGWLALALSLASAGVALTFERLARRTPLRFLYERPEWAKLAQPKPASASRRPLPRPPGTQPEFGSAYPDPLPEP